MKILEDLSQTYAQLRPNGSSKTHEVETFWKDVAEGRVEETGFGHLIGVFAFTEDWPTWEIHPAGDEFVHVLDGELELILRTKDGDISHHLRKGQSCLVPQGVWHTAKVRTPTRTLHVTPGDGSTTSENP